jgi:hypothetical protein
MKGDWEMSWKAYKACASLVNSTCPIFDCDPNVIAPPNKDLIAHYAELQKDQRGLMAGLIVTSVLWPFFLFATAVDGVAGVIFFLLSIGLFVAWIVFLVLASQNSQKQFIISQYFGISPYGTIEDL